MTAQSDLVDDLRSNCVDAVLLTARLLGWWVDEFAGRYVVDRRATWWWQTLTCAVSSFDYGDGDGLARVTEALGVGPVILLVTDEQPEPIAGFLGFADDLCAMMREVRAFEFVMFTIDLDRFVFDTHSNTLLVGPAAS